MTTTAHSALCAAAISGFAVAVDARPAAAAHPRHKGSHSTAAHAAHAAKHASHGGTHATSKHARAAGHHAAKHGTKQESRAARRHHHGRRSHEPAIEVAEAPPSLTIPQFALPDLAVAATTYPAGRTLAGFGGPVETAMVPPAAAARTLAALTHSAASLLDALVSRARSQLGTRYVFGGAEPGAGLDCSSFARYAMEALGVRLPRTANQQAQIGRPIPRDPNLLRPGDLLTFGSRSHVSHVGIYLGEGRFIHASVSHGQIIETTIDRNRSLFRRWQGARRLLAATGDSASGLGNTGG